MRQLEISKLIIDELAENKAQIMGQALLTACGYNCIDCVFLLINFDISNCLIMASFPYCCRLTVHFNRDAAS
jgi:hypothetical protein